MRDLREAEIVRQVLLGDVQRFAVLVREYQRPVYNLMLRMAGDETQAADLAQEAFTRAYERLHTFNMGRRFFPWLYSVALNVARDWLRRNGRDRLVYVDDAAAMARPEDRASAETDAAVEAARRLDGAKAFELVMRLDPKYREALILRYRHDFSMQEIADALGVTVSGAKMRVSRGLEMVRQHFEGENYDQ